MWIVRRATMFDSESRDGNFCREVVPPSPRFGSSVVIVRKQKFIRIGRITQSSFFGIKGRYVERDAYRDHFYVRSRYPLRSKVRCRDVGDADLKDIG
jgi:hypothetical protein